MKIGIVGSEAAKFTPETEAKARSVIRSLLGDRDIVISGGCHLGGVDIYAIEEAKKKGLGYHEYLPEARNWTGYKKRNLQIVNASDLVVCITVKTLPDNYKGMRFKICYHCNTDQHVKSGGCWTLKQAKKLGKKTYLVVI